MQFAEKILNNIGFYQAVIKSFPEIVVILDKTGEVIAVNDKWIAFAKENNGQDLAEHSIGNNYLNTCKVSSEKGSSDAQQAFDGIQKVINGTLDLFTLEYPCDSPTEKRWFILYASPLLIPEGGAVISHIDITKRKLAEMQLAKEKAELQKINTFMIDRELKIVELKKEIELLKTQGKNN
jgi:PAS domain-containing protein